ncbi:MAG: thioredoxin domain-containing protein [Myxococcota bacterium]
MKVVTLGLSLGVVALVATGCVSRSEIEEIKANQLKILEKLDKMGRGAGAPQAARPQGPDASKTYAVPVDGAALKGNKDAWVTVVAWSDFQCPFCSRVVPTLKQIEDTYKNDVRVVFKHNPLGFHQRAMPAALAAECGNEQGKFWQMHDTMFANQQKLEDADLEGYAKQAGLDMGRFKSCYSTQKYKSRIEEQQRQGMTLGARGTPAFFINGRFLSGAQPFPAFQALIDEELKKAKASGIDSDDYYAKMVVEKGEKSM